MYAFDRQLSPVTHKIIRPRNPVSNANEFNGILDFSFRTSEVEMVHLRKSRIIVSVEASIRNANANVAWIENLTPVSNACATLFSDVKLTLNDKLVENNTDIPVISTIERTLSESARETLNNSGSPVVYYGTNGKFDLNTSTELKKIAPMYGINLNNSALTRRFTVEMPFPVLWSDESQVIPGNVDYRVELQVSPNWRNQLMTNVADGAVLVQVIVLDPSLNGLYLNITDVRLDIFHEKTVTPYMSQPTRYEYMAVKSTTRSIPASSNSTFQITLDKNPLYFGFVILSPNVNTVLNESITSFNGTLSQNINSYTIRHGSNQYPNVQYDMNLTDVVSDTKRDNKIAFLNYLSVSEEFSHSSILDYKRWSLNPVFIHRADSFQDEANNSLDLDLQFNAASAGTLLFFSFYRNELQFNHSTREVFVRSVV